MAAPAPDTTNHSRIVAVRMPSQLEQKLEALAARDSNTISSTVRRLIAAGLRSEERSDRG